MTARYFYFDLDGKLLSESSWESIYRASSGGIVIAFDDVETENLQVITRWTGVPYSDDGDRFGIFETEVVIPLQIFVHESASEGWVGHPGKRAFSVDKFYTSTREKALNMHRIVMNNVFSGVMCREIRTAMSSAEREYRSGLPAF